MDIYPIYNDGAARECRIPAHHMNAETLGGKGYNLVTMAQLGLPVPSGVIIPTYVSKQYLAATNAAARSNILHPAVRPLFTSGAAAKLGFNVRATQYSARSGAPVFMPGMLDSVLNLGGAESEHRRTGAVAATKSIFDSWNSDRASAYRRLNGIPDDIGTAVILQEMVRGDLGSDSGTGVMFTRNPETGKKGLYGEFLIDAQGDKLVDGSTTPMPMHSMRGINHVWSTCYNRLQVYADILESHYKEMQDIEWTMQDGSVYLLQTRTGKRSPTAKFFIAKSMADEGLISRDDAIARINRKDFAKVAQPQIDSSADPICTGIGAAGGVVNGYAVFDVLDTEDGDRDYILVASETDPDDFPVMSRCSGIVTVRGGATSHAAIVARSMGIAAVVGTDFGELLDLGPGDKIAIDGRSGKVWDRHIGVTTPPTPRAVDAVVKWAKHAHRHGILHYVGYPFVSPQNWDTLRDKKSLFIDFDLATTGGVTHVNYMRSLLSQLSHHTDLYGVINVKQEHPADALLDRLLVLRDSHYNAGCRTQQERADDINEFLNTTTFPKSLQNRFCIIGAGEIDGWGGVHLAESIGDLLLADVPVRIAGELHALLREQGVGAAATQQMLGSRASTGTTRKVYEARIVVKDTYQNALFGT